MATFRVFVSAASTNDSMAQELRRQLELEISRGDTPGEPLVAAAWYGARSTPQDFADLWYAHGEAHLVAAIVTPDFLDSPICCEELIRAHALGIDCVALVSDKVSDFAARFTFASQIRSIAWTAPHSAEALESLLKAVLRLARDTKYTEAAADLHFLREPFLDALRRFKRPLDLSRAPSYMRTLGRNVARAYGSELETIYSGNSYKLDLGLEHNFLTRAQAIFSTSKEVFAISRQDISKFWLDRDTRFSAVQYIKTQSPGTVRLFVFKDASEVQDAARMLDASANAYGGSGAVLVCSVDTYQHLLTAKVLSDDKLNELKMVDFGLLQVEDQAGGWKWLFARLSRKSLEFSQIFEPELALFSALVSSLRQAKRDTQHEHDDAPGSYPDGLLFQPLQDPECRILRWKTGIWNSDPEQWARTLFGLFGAGKFADMRHVLLFAGSDGRLDQVLTRVRDDIRVALREADIQAEVWVGGRHEASGVKDGLYGGDLVVDSDDWRWRNALIMEFASYEGLVRWYEDRAKHPELRERVYRALDPKASELYEKLTRVALPAERRTGFAEIEAGMKTFLCRLDFVELEDFGAVATRSPSAFSVGE